MQYLPFKPSLYRLIWAEGTIQLSLKGFVTLSSFHLSQYYYSICFNLLCCMSLYECRLFRSSQLVVYSDFFIS